MQHIGIISLGCSKNLVDTEMMLGELTHNGYKITNNSEEADFLIINTCGFIGKAKEEGINTILEMSRYKKSGRCKRLIVMGCLAQRYGKELIKEIPEIDYVVGTGDILTILKVLKSKKNKQLSYKKNFVKPPSYQYNLKTERVLTTPAGSAYVKIAEGCSSKCSFCIIPKIRGPYQSRPLESILKEVNYLADKGIKEINLIAQDTTYYGRDLKLKNGLSTLLKKLVSCHGIEWIRLLYNHSVYITKELITLLQKESKLCKYIDIPIQHSHNTILKAMNRPEREKDIKKVIKQLRSNIPDISLRTSIIVGFPGEKEEHFKHLCDFIEEIQFDHLGVFQFSKEDGTSAAKLSGELDISIMNERFERIMGIQKGISFGKNKKKIGLVIPVLIENSVDGKENFFVGRESQQAPEVDGVVYVEGNELLPGSILNVKIKDVLEYDLFGEPV